MWQHEKEFEKLSLVFGESYILLEAVVLRGHLLCAQQQHIHQRRCVNVKEQVHHKR